MFWNLNISNFIHSRPLEFETLNIPDCIFGEDNRTVILTLQIIYVRSAGNWVLILAFYLLSMNDFVPDHNILPCFRSRFRCPLQFAPRDFFCHETVVILRREQTRPQEPSRRIFETSVRDSPARIFVFVRGQRVVSLSDKSQFVRQKCSLCEAGAFSRVKLLFLDTMETD